MPIFKLEKAPVYQVEQVPPMKKVKATLLSEEDDSKKSAPILSSRMTMETMGKIVWYELPPVIKTLIAITGGELRGGAIRDILNKEKVTDYDIYFDNEEQAMSSYTSLVENPAFTTLYTNIQCSKTNHGAYIAPAMNGKCKQLYDITVTYKEPKEISNNVLLNSNTPIYGGFVVEDKSVNIDIIVCSREDYKNNLDFTCNAGYYNTDSFGVLIDPDLFYWSVINKSLLPMSRPRGDGPYSRRVAHFYSKGYNHIYKQKTTNLWYLLKYLELI